MHSIAMLSRTISSFPIGVGDTLLPEYRYLQQHFEGIVICYLQNFIEYGTQNIGLFLPCHKSQTPLKYSVLKSLRTGLGLEVPLGLQVPQGQKFLALALKFCP
jgi:hypothetical protein